MDTHRHHTTRKTGLASLLLALALVAGACSSGTPSANQSSTPSSAESSTSPASPSSPTTETGTPTPTATPLTTGIVKGQDGWSTYTNAELGFRFRFPTKINAGNGSPCTKENEGRSDFSYRPAQGVVPTTVIKDGNWFFVTQKYGYLLGDEHESDGLYTFGSCTRFTTTAAIIRRYQTTNTYYSLSLLPVLVASARNRADVQEILATEYFRCADFTVTSLSPPSGGGRRDVRFECPSDPTFFNYELGTTLWTHQQLLEQFVFGQAVQIYDTAEKPADPRIAKSFRPVG